MKYLLIDPCYIGEKQLEKLHGSPVATYRTGDGKFELGDGNVTVDSGQINVYEVSDADDWLVQGDLAEAGPFAEAAYSNTIPTEKEVNMAVEKYDKE